MTKWSRTPALILGSILVASPLQAASLPGFVLQSQTEHVSFYSRDNQKVDSRKVEAYLVRISDLLGQPVEGRAEYYRYTSPEELQVATGVYGAGVTFPEQGQIHSTRQFHAHEIVHLVACRLGRPGSFFQEGIAVALGNEGQWKGQDVNRLSKAQAQSQTVSSLVARFDSLDPETAYPLAGSFVASLIKTHGLPMVVKFFRACSGRNTGLAFQQTFGQTLDEAGASWAASL